MISNSIPNHRTQSQPRCKVKLREVDCIFWPPSSSKFLSPDINRHLYPGYFLYSLDKAVFSLYPSQHRHWFFFLIILHKLSKDMLLFVNARFVSFLHSLRFPINPCCPKPNILPFLKVLFFSLKLYIVQNWGYSIYILPWLGFFFLIIISWKSLHISKIRLC